MLKDEVADQLVYATVRITANWDKVIKVGTGFFMVKESEEGASQFALVTNRHVVEGAKNIILHMVLKNIDGTPNDSNHLELKIDSVQDVCKYHPNTLMDICLISIGDQFEELKKNGCDIYYKQISTTMIVSPEGLESLTPIEDVVMIGYPNGIMDTANYKPVVRSGITATDLKKDYNGKPEFMIDIACFEGSSGSPVFLRKQGLEKEQTTDGITLAIKPQYAFLGVLYSGPYYTADGKIVVEDIPTAAVPMAKTKTMINLGYVIKAKKIIEMFD